MLFSDTCASRAGKDATTAPRDPLFLALFDPKRDSAHCNYFGSSLVCSGVCCWFVDEKGKKSCRHLPVGADGGGGGSALANKILGWTTLDIGAVGTGKCKDPNAESFDCALDAFGKCPKECCLVSKGSQVACKQITCEERLNTPPLGQRYVVRETLCSSSISGSAIGSDSRGRGGCSGSLSSSSSCCVSSASTSSSSAPLCYTYQLAECPEMRSYECEARCPHPNNVPGDAFSSIYRPPSDSNGVFLDTMLDSPELTMTEFIPWAGDQLCYQHTALDACKSVCSHPETLNPIDFQTSARINNEGCVATSAFNPKVQFRCILYGAGPSNQNVGNDNVDWDTIPDGLSFSD
eukprot:gnl/Spiro4/16398_TR8806_c0_g1_i1.p1 gnl/Spiro4/16398_TR8806_c0_g1~~gnl/Spiro4/16398_TR8806_c0_g1_i1.p1  ORF type:complete len:367 (-),score=56.94 gnl/Spiro4/16398_TR8806_c0_g1_i1:57-1103(-)